MALAIDAMFGDFQRDAGDTRQIGAVSRALQQSDGDNVTLNSATSRCALSGTSVRLLEGNFPQPNLPGLGQTYLFARNKDIPALSRYGQTGAASLSIDAELAGRLSGAILALTEAEREGKTWRLIPAETGDKPDLFIASLASDPTASLADYLATEDDVTGWPAVEAAAEGALQHVDGIVVSASPQDEVRLLVVRTIDPANRKVVCDRRSTAGMLHAAAVRWNSAMRNIPTGIAFPVGTKTGIVLRRPPRLPPLTLVPVSRKMFANGGRRRVDMLGSPASDAFALFLGDAAAKNHAVRALTTLIKRQQPLVAGLAHAAARGREGLKGFDPTMDLRRDALRSIAWLGGLLHMLGRPKEIYMTDTAFKLGQLLSAVDSMHIGYCADLRGGSVPPTLLGNAVFAIAGRDPVRALDVLQGRWKPYGAWARRVDHVNRKAAQLQGGKDDQLAWNMRRGISQARLAGPLCAELQAAIPKVQVDGRFRAELLLGYVAGIDREPKAESDKRSKKGDSKEIAA